MKKLFCVFLIAGILLCAQGCSKEDNDNDQDNSSSEVSQSSEVSEEEQIYNVLPLLENSFGKLAKENEYFIETDMTVESINSPDKIFRYRLSVAIDKKNNKGMSLMAVTDDDQSESGTVINHIIIKDKTLYNISDSTQTYKTESYKYSVENFGKIYTTEQYLGITEHLIPDVSGQAEIILDGSDQKITADYERYRMSVNSSVTPSADDTYITYYFKDKKPILEIMENSEGKTTYTIRTLSYKIPDASVFDTNGYYPESE